MVKQKKKKLNSDQIFIIIAFSIVLLIVIWVTNNKVEIEDGTTISKDQEKKIIENARKQIEEKYEVTSILSVKIKSYHEYSDCYDGTINFKAPNGFNEIKEWSEKFNCVTDQ